MILKMNFNFNFNVKDSPASVASQSAAVQADVIRITLYI
jgi:hypothetical protein